MANPTLRELPRVDRVLGLPDVRILTERFGVGLVTNLVRSAIDAARSEILAGGRGAAPSDADIAREVSVEAARLDAAKTRFVINATGILVHTNLGRAPLSGAAREALNETARGYASLEMDLASGKRGGRGAFAEIALATLASAEAALVVNNCAAAVLLSLASIAKGRGVIVSRGELVEIGGSFRVPEILEESGARLIEVGTTNRTHLADYERALDENPDAAAILRVHQGNFRMTGFVERPSLRELADLSLKRGIPLIKDLGGGALVELAELAADGASRGFTGEPTAMSSIRAGADLVCFSGDKVLGGPQAGVIIGKRALVERARKHPLARALRLGRLPLVALEATLESYLSGDVTEIPALAAIARPLAEIEARAASWAEALSSNKTLEAAEVSVRVVPTEVEMGGGALADRHIPSHGVAIRSKRSPDALASGLRLGRPAVLARVQGDALVLDARTVLPGEDAALIARVLEVLSLRT